MADELNDNNRMINQYEWIWLIIAILIIVTLANLPYVLGYVAANDNAFFGGVTIAPEDNLSYIAKIRQGAMGNWLFRLSYSSLEQKGVPIYLFYLLIGHISRLLNLSPVAAYHMTRVIGEVCLLINVYLLISDITNDVNKKRFVFMVVALSSGLGWLVIALNGKSLSTDITVPESNTFLSLMDTAHFTWGQALLIMIWREFISVIKNAKPLFFSAILLCVETILLILIQPFMTAIVFGVIDIFIIFEIRYYKKEKLINLLVIGVVFCIDLIIVGITYGWIYSDAVFKQWNRQLVAMSPPVLYFILGFGLNLIPMIYGITLIYRKGAVEKLLLCWLICAAIGLYIPINLQRRLSLGMHIPIALIAGIGFYDFVHTKMSFYSFRRILTLAYIFLTIPTNILLVIIFSAGVLNQDPKLFMSKDEYEALQQLNEVGKKDKVVLSSSVLGAFIPAYTDHFAVSGHAFETINFIETDKDIKRFYSPSTSSNDRKSMLQKWRVTYVLLGSREAIYGINSLTQSDGVYEVNTFGEVKLYSVLPLSK